jgi:hypothetical protein
MPIIVRVQPACMSGLCVLARLGSSWVRSADAQASFRPGRSQVKQDSKSVNSGIN